MNPVDDPLVLPAPPAEPRRPGFPLVGALMPVLGGVLLWLITGSLFALWFAALGPLIAVGALADQARVRRRERRAGAAAHAEALSRLEREIQRRHGIERSELERRHPDVCRLAQRADEIWRPVDGRTDALAAGRGRRPSDLRVSGSADGDERAIQVRAASVVLEDAPVTVSWRRGMAVRGAPVLAEAVLRALVLQLCLLHGPQNLRIVGAAPPGWEWLEELPHRGVAHEGIVSLAVQTPASRAPSDADVVFAWGAQATAVDPRCGAVVQVSALGVAELHTSGGITPLRLEAVSAAQARSVARALSARARAVFGDTERAGAVGWGDLPHAAADGDVASDRATLGVALGLDGSVPVIVDLVRDGPHAVVAGVTGSGKSELLTTWVARICAAYSPAQVSFLLADFKGGMTFRSLECLPHVTGVITDLDGPAAQRAIASLRAELRAREAELARCGARDVADPAVGLGRLVIVVDEFAALLDDHPELHRVFADVAARGRALGMHLLLGTQRASGVVRDALLANCPLRIVLRVAEPGESRALIGDDAAARLPGGERARGRALVRGAGDEVPTPLRVALTTPTDITAVSESSARHPSPRAPWLPPLPSTLTLADLAAQAERDEREVADETPQLLLALADDPARQRRVVRAMRGRDRGLVVVGGPGSGKTSVAALVAAQSPAAVVVPRDPEAAWDTICRATADPPPLLVVDDADLLLARLPQEHAAALAGHLEGLARDAGATGTRIVLTALRLTGSLARIAESLPRRAILGLASAADHLAAGGASREYVADRPPGRGVLDGFEVQFARADRDLPDERTTSVSPWRPGAVTLVVARRAASVASRLAAVHGDGVRVMNLAGTAPTDAAAAVAAATRTHPVILVGDGDAWQAHWALLQGQRTRHPVVVDAACPAELRVLAGERELPPYAVPGADRAWLCRDGDSPRRVQLVPADAAAARR